MTHGGRANAGNNADAILLEGLRVSSALGVSEAERKLRRPVLLDLELGFDLTAAGRSDVLGDTIDYGEIYSVGESVAGAGEHKLVEALGERIIEALFDAFAIDWVRIWVRKPKPIAGDLDTCGIRITRSRT